jgi:Arm DNA-binding domain
LLRQPPVSSHISLLHADGKGLYLRVKPSNGVNRKSWVFRFRGPDGRDRWMGFGSLEEVTLARALDAFEIGLAHSSAVKAKASLVS